jgi:hypothetical protein
MTASGMAGESSTPAPGPLLGLEVAAAAPLVAAAAHWLARAGVAGRRAGQHPDLLEPSSLWSPLLLVEAEQASTRPSYIPHKATTQSGRLVTEPPAQRTDRSLEA